MTTFNLTIDCDNAAFGEPALNVVLRDEGYAEVARILRALANQFDTWPRADGPVFDPDGNTVGGWQVTR